MPGTVALGASPSTLSWVLRLSGAGLLAAMAAIHGYLWAQGYDGIPVIGAAFLANAVLGFLGALLLCIPTHRLLSWVAGAGAALAAGTLVALILSTTVGLFGFVESTAAPLWWESLWVETGALVVLGVLTVVSLPPERRHGR